MRKLSFAALALAAAVTMSAAPQASKTNNVKGETTAAHSATGKEKKDKKAKKEAKKMAKEKKAATHPKP